MVIVPVLQSHSGGTSIAENRHSKIFLTFEALERLRLREDTISGFEQYMRQVDKSFGESEDKKADERAKGKVAGMMAVLSDKTGSALKFAVNGCASTAGFAEKRSSSPSTYCRTARRKSLISCAFSGESAIRSSSRAIGMPLSSARKIFAPDAFSFCA